MLQNSESETFAAVCACKRAKRVTTQVLPKASFAIKQERSAQMTGAVTDVTLSQLPLFIRQTPDFSGLKSRTPAAHHCKPSLLLISWRMDKIPAVHLFFLIHGPIDLESLMCKVLSRQRVFMKQLLGHRTRVTLRSSPRQDDKNLNLVNSCVGHAETALVSSTCTATAQSFQQGDLVVCEASIYWILLDLR